MIKSKHKKTSTHTHVTFSIKTGDCVVASQEKIQKVSSLTELNEMCMGHFPYSALLE